MPFRQVRACFGVMFTVLTLLAASSVSAAEGEHDLVDRLSNRIDASLCDAGDGESLRAQSVAATSGQRSSVVAAIFLDCDAEERCRLKLDVRQPGAGPRLFLVDAGAVFRGPGDADFVPVPNQRFVLEHQQNTLEIDALPLRSGRPKPPKNSPLKVAASNSAGLLTVLRTVQRIETEDAQRLRRYVKEAGGAFTVDTFVDNEDVRAARWMLWTKGHDGQPQARLPLEVVRFALYAVTSEYTINEVADWFRTFRQMDMNPAIAAAGDAARRVEFVLERAGLNYRIFSPNHADYHFNRGVTAYQNSDLDGATKAFTAAIAKNPNLVPAHYNLGITLYRKGKYADAESALQIATGLDDAGAEVFYNRGAVLFRQGDKPSAARMFRRAIELNARDPEAGVWLSKADPEGKTAVKTKMPTKKKLR